MIVGAQKAGTTTLLEYLALHPRVERQVTPEMTWFTDPGLEVAGLAALAQRYFPRSSGERVRVGKLAGLMYEEGAVHRLDRHVPGVQVVAVLRDPVRRAYSAFLHARVRGREPVADFATALDADPARFADEASRRICAYVERGQYAEPVQRLIDTFGARCHVVFFEDLVANPGAALTSLTTAVGLDPALLSESLPLANRARVRRTPLAGLPRTKVARLAAQFLAPRARDRVRGGLRRITEAQGAASLLDPELEANLRDQFAPSNARLGEVLKRPVPSAW